MGLCDLQDTPPTRVLPGEMALLAFISLKAQFSRCAAAMRVREADDMPASRLGRRIEHECVLCVRLARTRLAAAMSTLPMEPGSKPASSLKHGERLQVLLRISELASCLQDSHRHHR